LGVLLDDGFSDELYENIRETTEEFLLSPGGYVTGSVIEFDSLFDQYEVEMNKLI
jgi:hypothetical protein